MTAASNSASHPSHFQTIQLPNLAGKEAIKAIEVESKEWLLNPAKVFLFDFAKVLTIDKEALPQLMQFITQAKKIEKQVHSIHVSSSIHSELSQKGVLSSFNVHKTLQDFEKVISPQQKTAGAPKVDANVLQVFVDGAAKAFEVQVKAKVRAGKFSSKKKQFESDDAVVGTIDVKTPGFTGSISICFSKEAFVNTYKALLGEDLPEVTDESKDAAGEILNIVYGHAKTDLNKSLGFQLQPAIPRVALNPDPVPSTKPVIVIPFSSDLGQFRLEILVQ